MTHDSNVIQIKHLTLIGTAHVSENSVQEVKQTIAKIQPQHVCVELDKQRYENIKYKNKWQDTDIITVIKEKKLAGLIIQIVLAFIQNKMTTTTESGAELKQAIQSAKENNAEIKLIDRNIKITLNRIWRKITFREKISMIGSVFETAEEDMTEEKIEKIMENDVIEVAFSNMEKQLPIIHHVLIAERDQYMANNLINIMSKTDQPIVAVIGKGHLKGITTILENNQPTENNEQLDIIPDKKFSTKLLEIAFPTLIIGLIIASFFISSEQGFNQLTTWILWNSSLAALFTLLSGGHILSVLTAFITAPIGTLNPVLSVGVFVAFVEATLRKPRVKDMENILHDISGIKTFIGNRFLKILLLFLVSNLGGALGNIIGGSQLIRNLFN